MCVAQKAVRTLYIWCFSHTWSWIRDYPYADDTGIQRLAPHYTLNRQGDHNDNVVAGILPGNHAGGDDQASFRRTTFTYKAEQRCSNLLGEAEGTGPAEGKIYQTILKVGKWQTNQL